jgi:hypothetical protein
MNQVGGKPPIKERGLESDKQDLAFHAATLACFAS